MGTSRKAEGREEEKEQEKEKEEEIEVQQQEMVEDVQRDHHKSENDENEERKAKRRRKAKEVKDAPKRGKPWGNSGSGSSSFWILGQNWLCALQQKELRERRRRW